MNFKDIRKGMVFWSKDFNQAVYVNELYNDEEEIMDTNGNLYSSDELTTITKTQLLTEVKKLDSQIGKINLKVHACNEVLLYEE